MAKKKYFGLTGGQIVILLVIVAGVYFLMGGKVPTFTATGVPAIAPTPSGPVTGTCEQSTSIPITYSVYDSIRNGTQLTDYNVIYFVDGARGGEVAAGTAFNVRSGSTVTIYALDDAGAHDVYGFVDSIAVGCQPVFIQSTRGMQDGTLSLSVYQSDDITANVVGAPETLGVGATALGRLRIKENTVDGFWSTTEGGQKVLVVEDINSNAFSTFEVTSANPSTAIAKVSNPTGHTTLDATNALTTISYEITSDVLRNYGILDVYFRAPALSTVNPNNDSNIQFTVSDKELYLNTDTGTFMLDYRNAVTNADLGETDGTDTYHIA